MKPKYSKKDFVLCVLALVVFIPIAVTVTVTLPITSIGAILFHVLAWSIVAATIWLFIRILLNLRYGASNGKKKI